MRTLVPTLLLAACAHPSTIDGIVLPDVASATFVTGVDHPLFPLPVGATWSYTATNGEVDDVEVLAESRDVNGVQAVVVYDVVSVAGEITEETWDWFAQDAAGNVWYLGEDTCEYEDGACAVRDGAWEWGVGGALPGIVMPASPAVDGQPYFQEYARGEAEDVGEVIGVGEAITVGTTAYTDCVRTRDTSHLDRRLREEKVYCPGVGNVYVDEGGVEVDLVGTTGL